MSRRNHRNNGNRDNSGSWWPRPPMKKVYRRSYKPHWEPTEVHRALTSFGMDDRTSRLSDAEFYSQVGDEIGYLARKSGAHFGRALGALGELLNELF